MIYYFGIDASLTSPGFCVAGDNDPYIKSSSHQSKFKGMKRVEEIVEHLKIGYLTSLNLNKILIEGYSFGSKGGMVMDRAELVGIIKYILLHLGHELIIIPPTTLKQFATGKGNSDKTAMVLQAYKEFGLEFKCNDECDAFWLVQIGRAMDGHWEGLSRTKVRDAVIEKLKG